MYDFYSYGEPFRAAQPEEVLSPQAARWARDNAAKHMPSRVMSEVVVLDPVEETQPLRELSYQVAAQVPTALSAE